MMGSDAPTRRWLQFSVKGLLILMLVVAGYCAGWATANRRVRQAEEQAQQEAKKAMMMAREAEMQAMRAQAALAAAKAQAATAQLEARLRANKSSSSP